MGNTEAHPLPPPQTTHSQDCTHTLPHYPLPHSQAGPLAAPHALRASPVAFAGQLPTSTSSAPPPPPPSLPPSTCQHRRTEHPCSTAGLPRLRETLPRLWSERGAERSRWKTRAVL